ncbi:MarR family winged helix-turn-helix transcriptional regulator [Halocola ammonii]
MHSQELLALKNQLCFPLYATSRLTTKLYAPLLEKLDITYPQYLVLLVLWERDVQSVSTIGKTLYLESNTLTPLLKRMEQKGLLVRERSKEDERTVMVSLTEKGKDLREEAVCIPKQIIESLSGEEIDEKEIKQFRKTLYKILGQLSEVESK